MKSYLFIQTNTSWFQTTWVYS